MRLKNTSIRFDDKHFEAFTQLQPQITKPQEIVDFLFEEYLGKGDGKPFIPSTIKKNILNTSETDDAVKYVNRENEILQTTDFTFIKIFQREDHTAYPMSEAPKTGAERQLYLSKKKASDDRIIKAWETFKTVDGK